jgi:hypothetical protein
MAATSVVVKHQRRALEEIGDIVEELDPEAAAKLNRFTPGGVMPSPNKRPEEANLFLAEAVLILARAVRGKKRGRPKNVVFHDKEQAS